MGDKSKIEWTDATWNPVTGCTKVSDGCKNCYAERLFPRVYGKQTVYRQYKEIQGGHPPGLPVKRQFTDVMCHPERLDAPLHWRKPRRVFVNSMSDLFHEDVPDEFIQEVFAVMALTERHTFQILTKRAARMHAFMSNTMNSFMAEGRAQRRYYERTGEDPTEWLAVHFPLPNVQLGVSAEDQKTADERIPMLQQTPAAVRFVSLEPLRGEIHLRELDIGDLCWLNALTGKVRIAHDGGMPEPAKYAALDWVIAGGESGPGARPSHPDWFRQVRDQCQAAGVPFFFKQWGEWVNSEINVSAAKRATFVRLDGTTHTYDATGSYFASDAAMYRVGKKAAGRLLDGRTWDEYPA